MTKPRKYKLAGNGLLYETKLFTVEGSGVFAFDMLRYDSCWPRSEGKDSARVAGQGRRRIVLETHSPIAPTVERWASFGWKVIGEGELREDWDWWSVAQAHADCEE